MRRPTGAHVANADDLVAEHCRRQGIGSRLCQHSLQAARRLGFRAMQFNLVVSTNTGGIRCWRRNGFQVVGTLPEAFRHKQLAYVIPSTRTAAALTAQATNRPYSQRTKPPTTGTGSKVGPTKSK